MPRLVAIEAPAAGLADIEAVHDPAYVRTVKTEIEAGRDTLSTGDTPLSAGSWEAALRAAGCLLAAADAVVCGRVTRAFCAVRPPGHHASRARGMGFCVFNNVAIAARYLQRKHGVGRVLVVDWDVHHGNGTQAIFYEDPTVFYFSVHQHPWYPGTGLESESGSGAGRGFTLNCPLPAGSGDEEVTRAFSEKLAPAAQRFKPEFVLVSAGFDARAGDPLGGMKVTDEGFARLTAIVAGIAGEYASGRIVSSLEGGYSLSGLASAAEAHVRRLGER
jgi:acetoin utilization deacetylase AcuC-like enzyme